MQFTQKKLSSTQSFNFGHEKLFYGFVEKTGSADLEAYYADIPDKTSTLIERNEWFKNAGIIWVIIGLIQITASIYSETFTVGHTFWFILGASCFAWFLYSKTEYTVLRTNVGNIFVMKDEVHDEILAQMAQRKNEQLFNWYGEINFKNDPEKEINKFKWLAEINVISTKEADNKIAQINLALNEHLTSDQSIN